MKYLFSFLSFLILIGLIFFYLQISKPVEINANTTKIKQSSQAKKNFFHIKKVDIAKLPVKVLYMKIDFYKYKYRVIYKVSINNVDRYALFNIKTILNSFNTTYSLIKTKKTEIYIFFKNLKEANSVLSLFKEYNFNIKIEKIKKRI